MARQVLRIGGAAGFWGDSDVALPQLLDAGDLDVILFDYLAEVTLSIMARARARDPEAGYATDFVTAVIGPHLTRIAEQRVRIVTNAGGMNPQACGRAVEALIAAAGLDLTVAVVTGDDLLDRAVDFPDRREMFTGAAFPPLDRLASINAYLGAFPIARALDLGADIVITGRCADSALALGPCIHRFGWGPQDLDLLATGSLAGHLLECGPQATGGNFTDWRQVAGGPAAIGYPIAEIDAAGGLVVTKPEGTGGRVTPLTVGEQMLYEIGDPAAYALPDVICDFTAVTLDQCAPDRVRLRGARGYPAPRQLKVSATFADGHRAGMIGFMIGADAAAKARFLAEHALQRARETLARRGAPDFSETLIELIGDGGAFGTPDTAARDVAVKVAVRHPDARAAALVVREMTGLALATPPGLTFFAGGQSKPTPVVRLFSFLLERDQVRPLVWIGGSATSVPCLPGQDNSPPPAQTLPPLPRTAPADLITVPLLRLAVARSGDKGDSANIGVLSRHPALAPWIWAALDEATVAAVFAPWLNGEVRRFALPGCHGMNLVLDRVLGGGGMASLRNDPQGKAFAQILLQTPVPVPAALLETLT